MTERESQPFTTRPMRGASVLSAASATVVVALIRDQGADFELNEPDAYALEEALRLKEKHGGEVVAISAGPPRVTQALREALAG